MTDIENAPVLALDMAEVGNCLLRLLTTSITLGHSRPQHTLVYVHPPAGSAAEFVTDVLALSNEQLADKWLGGSEGAGKLHRATAQQAFAGIIQQIGPVWEKAHRERMDRHIANVRLIGAEIPADLAAKYCGNDESALG